MGSAESFNSQVLTFSESNFGRCMKKPFKLTITGYLRAQPAPFPTTLVKSVRGGVSIKAVARGTRTMKIKYSKIAPYI